MSHVRITPAILRWAQHRAGLNHEQLAKKIGFANKQEELRAWEEGKEQPTFKQAQALARALQIPLGYLFLSAPPPTILPLADFRYLPQTDRGKFSPDLQDVLNDALRKRDWFREWRIQEGYEPHPFIGKYGLGGKPEQIADDIRNTLSLPNPTARDVRTWSDHLRFLIRHAEQVGILVLQSGIVLNNPKRTLSVDEFRGFTLADEYAPLIFINTRDSIAARIFTLSHELGHLWTGTSGISNPVLSPQLSSDIASIERLCNQIAAELLVPREALIAQWDPGQDLIDASQDLAKQFRVSVFVILIRIYELDLVSRNDFEICYSRAIAEARDNLSSKEEGGGGGDFYKNVLRRNSRLFVQEVTSALSEGHLLHQEAAQLLNIHPWTLENAIQHWR